MVRTVSIIGIFALMLGFGLTGAAQHAVAHPHVWIDLKSQFEFDTDGRITGLQIDWTFDELYSAFVIADAGGVDVVDQTALTAIGRRNLANLREYDYFTEFLADGQPQRLGIPETFDTGLQDGKLWLRFSVPLETPLVPGDQRISYAVFDPSYFISIVHTDNDYGASPPNIPETCTTVLEPPNPTTDAISFAESLDRQDNAPESFGALFAERVRLECN